MAYVGIDLGTTNSVVTIVDPKTRKVKILGIENEAAYLPPEERKLVRSVVASQNGQYLRGWKAFTYAKVDPKNTIFSVKRLMGRGYNDRQEYGAGRNKGRPIRELMRENWCFETVEPEGATEDAVAVLLEGREHSPQEISKHILLEVKRVAEASLGEKVEGAVITVPAYFNEKQCSAAVEAAKMAGITVQRIFPEPTAAAKAYARDTLSLTPRTVLVYDLGGGTFDVTLLEIQGPNVKVETIDGDNWLGGDDFDREIVDDLVDVIRRETGRDPRNNYSLMFELRMRAEKAKKELSIEQEVEILISNLFPGCPPVTLVRKSEELEKARKHNPNKVYIERSYEDMISEYVEETVQLVNAVLKRKNCKADDVDKVLLVGGATKTSLVRERLAEIFGEDRLETEGVDPMLAVAIGAAYESDLLIERKIIVCPWYLKDSEPCVTENRTGTKTCVKCGKPLPVEDNPPTERPYGVEAYDSKKKRYEFDVIIPKDEPYPLKDPIKRIYYIGASGARMLKVRFFAGEKWEGGDFHEEVEKNEYQGTVWMLLPPETPAGSRVDIGFNLNKNKEMADISIKCQEEVVRKEMISRGGKDEALGLRIGDAMKRIQALLDEGNIKKDKTNELMNVGYSAIDLIIESYRASGEHKERLLADAEQQIKTLEDKIKEYEDGPVPIDGPFTFAKGMRNYAYFVLQEYYWLPFLQDESRLAEIRATLKELEEVIKRGEKAIEHKDERAIKRELDEAMYLTAKLGALLADRVLDMLESIRIAILVAKGGTRKKGKTGEVVSGPWKERPEISQKAGSAEGLQDAKVMQEGFNKIVMFLKRGKVKEAEDAYREIEHLILKWIVKVGA